MITPPPASSVADAPRVAPSRGSRIAGAALVVLLAPLLVVAAWLEPTASGVGTHEQLGMSRCGFLASTGLPCGLPHCSQ